MMTLGIHFNEGIADILTALNESNAMMTEMALAAGADARDTQLVRYSYQSALTHVGRALGLQWPELVIILSDVSHSQQPTVLGLCRKPKG